MDRGAWRATVHTVAKESDTTERFTHTHTHTHLSGRLSGWGTLTLTLEKDMATHSSVCVWRIPWTEEPGGLQSKGS